MTDNAPVKNIGKLLHAYIISGGSAASREAYAKKIAGEAVCGEKNAPCGACSNCIKADKGIHPDIIFVEKHEDKKEITVDIIRSVRAEAYIMPNDADRKVYIIRDADIMNAESQNAVLKILEEPPSFVVFLLLAENPSRLLPTVRSRCAVLSVKAEEQEAVSETVEELVNAWEKGDTVEAAAILMALDETKKADKMEFPQILEEAKRAALAKLKNGGNKERIMKLFDAIAEAEKYQTVNVGRVHLTGLFLSRLV